VEAARVSWGSGGGHDVDITLCGKKGEGDHGKGVTQGRNRKSLVLERMFCREEFWGGEESLNFR
jgi:hypothetical protein